MYGFSIFAFSVNVKVIPLLYELYLKIRTRQIDLIAEVSEKYEI